MTDEEMAAADRAFLQALRTFIEACEAYGAWTLDSCDPIRHLANDACWAVDQVQASLDSAERRITQARIEARRRGRTKGA